MRWKSPATRCCRPIATATSSSFRLPRPVRRGDRVVVKTKKGEVMVKELKRQTAKSVELKSLNADHPERVLPLDDVVWIARIVWASQ